MRRKTGGEAGAKSRQELIEELIQKSKQEKVATRCANELM